MSLLKPRSPSLATQKVIREMEKKEMVHFTIRICPDLKQKLQLNAINNKTKATYIVRSLIEKYLRETDKKNN